MKKKLTPFLEYFSESTTACLITMVQGNVLALTAGHLLIASQTGLIAGGLSAIALFIARNSSRWVISLTIGTITAVVDFFVHPGQFGSIATEAVVTGLGAAALSYLVGSAIRWFRSIGAEPE